MSTLIGLVGAVVGFGVVVAIHEFGHFLGGLITKSAMDEFSIGMGTKIVGKKFGGMQFNLRMLPLGGFVRFATIKSDQEFNCQPTGAAISAEKQYTKRASSSYLENKNPWQRLLVSLMGPVFSAILCPACLLIVFMHAGVAEVKIASIDTESPAEQAGLKAGDTILALNGEKTTSGLLFTVQLKETKPGDLIELRYVRDGLNKSVIFSPFNKEGITKIGVSLEEKRKPANFYKAGEDALSHTVNLTHRMLYGLKQIFSGDVNSDSVSGPAGILKMFSASAKAGIAAYLNFMAILTLNLAIVNMLPFPPLDGGNIVIDGYEAITTRKLPQVAVKGLRAIFTLLLLCLMLFTFFMDLKKF